MSNTRKWGLMVGVLVLFIVVSGLFWVRSQSGTTVIDTLRGISSEQEAPLSSNISAPTSYKNERYNFELTYPEDVQLNAVDECGGMDPNGPESCSGVSITINNNPQLIHIDILSNNNDQSFDDFVKYITRESQVRDIARKPIGGKETKSLIVKGGVELGAVQELIEKETRLGFINIGNDKMLYFRYEVDGLSEESLYEEILATLTFPLAESSDMRMYRNERLGFEMKIPETVDGGSIREIENGNIVWFATEKRASQDDRKLLESAVSEYKKVQNLSWAILVHTVETEQALDAFIKERYGNECGLGEKQPSSQAGVFNVSVDTGESEPGEGCFLNWSFHIKYSPELRRVAVWDIGQDGQFYSIDGKSGYDGRMAKSFRFMPLE